MYPKELVDKIRRETVSFGLVELKSEQEVKKAFSENSFILFFNSVCGCTSRVVRPGLALLVKDTKIPIYSVFAGADFSACEYARSLIKGYPPSSPSLFIIKNGEVLFALERQQLHSMTGEDVYSEVVSFLKEV